MRSLILLTPFICFALTAFSQNVGIGVASGAIPAESKLVIGAVNSTSEGGQIQLNAPGGTFSTAYFLDNYENSFRVLSGTDAGSTRTRLSIDSNGNLGVGLPNPAAKLHINQGSVVFTSAAASLGDVPVSGPGRRLLWFGDKAAFRVGQAFGQDWNTDSIGFYSVAMGTGTKATGSASTAMGLGSQATGSTSTAIGFNSTASGNYSTAMGYLSTASGAYSTAMGNGNLASGVNSTAMGFNTFSSGNHATSAGIETIARTYAEVAVGAFNIASVENGEFGLSATSWIGTDRLFTVGNGTSNTNRSDALVILKNGSMKIGSRGTFFTNLQQGLISAGTQSGNNKKAVTLTFTNPFANPNNVRVQITPRKEGGITDVFILGVRDITTTQCTVDIYRADAAAGTGWGASFDIQWMAWE